MPRTLDEPRPLTRHEIFQVLQGIASSPPSVPPAVALEAMSVTASSMLAWCSPGAVVIPPITWPQALATRQTEHVSSVRG